MKAQEKRHLMISCFGLEQFYKFIENKRLGTKQYFITLSDGSSNRWELTLFSNNQASKCPILSLSTSNTTMLVELIEQNNQKIKTLANSILEILEKDSSLGRCLLEIPHGPTLTLTVYKDQRPINDSDLQTPNTFTNSQQEPILHTQNHLSNQFISQEAREQQTQSVTAFQERYLKQQSSQRSKKSFNLQKIDRRFKDLDTKKPQFSNRISQNPFITDGIRNSSINHCNNKDKTNNIIIDGDEESQSSNIFRQTLREQSPKINPKKLPMCRQRSSNYAIEEIIMIQPTQRERIKSFKNPFDTSLNSNTQSKVGWKLKKREECHTKKTQLSEKNIQLYKQISLKEKNPQESLQHQQKSIKNKNINQVQIKKFDLSIQTEIKTKNSLNLRLNFNQIEVSYSPKIKEDESAEPKSLKIDSNIQRYHTEGNYSNFHHDSSVEQEIWHQRDNGSAQQEHYRYNIVFSSIQVNLNHNESQTYVKLTINNNAVCTQISIGKVIIFQNQIFTFHNISKYDSLFLSLHHLKQKISFAKITIPIIKILNNTYVQTCVLHKKTIAGIVFLNYRVKKISNLSNFKLPNIKTSWVETKRKKKKQNNGWKVAKKVVAPQMKRYLGGANIMIGRAPRFSYVESKSLAGPGRYNISLPFTRHSSKEQ